MATLNTLRTKGGVLLAVVIGISLLAFLLGDLTSSSSTLLNSSKMVIGEIDGSKISYQEYQSKVEELTRVQEVLGGSDVLSEAQITAVRNQAWEQIIRNSVFTSSLEALGLSVYDEEALDMADGENISSVLEAIFVNPQTGIFDQNMVRMFVGNLDADPTGNSRFFWIYLEKEMAQERAMEKYMSLVTSGVFVTDYEVSCGVRATDEYSNINYVVKRFTSVADSLVTPTESQLKAYYDKNKAQFKQVEARDIEYVTFDALPSDKDYADAESYVKGIADEFRNTEDMKQFVSLNSMEQFNSRYMAKSALQGEVAEFAFTEGKGAMLGPIFANDTYTMYRISDIKEIPDTISARHIILQAGNTSLADSIVNVLKSGKGNFVELAAQHSLDKNTPGGDLGRFDPQMMPENMSTPLINAKTGEIVTLSTPYGTHIMEVTYRGPSSKKVQLASVVYKVEPSNQTQQDVYSKAVAFAADAKAGDFNKAVSENSLSKRVARLRAGERNVNGIPQSTEIVRWAFDADRGDLSDVITIGESNIVVYVANKREHGFAPFAAVKEDIRPEVIRLNKEAYIAKEMSGEGSLSSIASKVGAEVESAENVNFNMYYVQNLGIAPEVIGAISNLNSGGITIPTPSMAGMVVAEVVSKEDRKETTADAQKVLLTSNAQSQLPNRAFDAIYRMNEIKDMRVRFF